MTPCPRYGVAGQGKFLILVGLGKPEIAGNQTFNVLSGTEGVVVPPLPGPRQYLHLVDIVTKEKMPTNKKSAKVVYDLIFEKLSNKENLKIDYIAIVDDYNLKTRENLDKNTVILIAAYVGSTRLIDNLHLEDIL